MQNAPRAMESGQQTTERKQVKSRARVRDHGEVFTAEREVKAMCDLVKGETERIDSRFLEPACGDGNFLSEILSRKLASVTRQYRRRLFDWEVKSLVALGSLYGVDILDDNVVACRERLFLQWDNEYSRLFKTKKDDGVLKSARFILERNIVRGNALSMKLVDDGATDTDAPIVFSQWSLLSSGLKMRREDFSFAHLLEQAKEDKNIVPDTVPSADNLPLTASMKPAKDAEQLELFRDGMDASTKRPLQNGHAMGASLPDSDGHFLGSRIYPSRRIFEE